MTRGAVWTAGTLLLAGLLCACQRGEERYHVSARLVDELPPARQVGVSAECAIGDEHRPALGCMPWRPRGNIPVQAGTPADIGFAVAPGERGRPVFLRVNLFRPQLKKKKMQEIAGPLVVRPRDARTTIELPDFPPADAGPGSAVLLWGRALPPTLYETRRVAVPPRSLVTLGIGLDPETPPDGVKSVAFRLDADAGAGWQELLSVVLQPGSPSTARWEDHVIPLDALAGKTTRFRFMTRLEPLGDLDPAQAAAVPLWGAPEILTAASDDERPNVILISLDTLRRDHVGALGSPLPLTPHIDALAAEGTVFENASTTFPSTTGGHLSMLTGRYPIRLGVSDPSRGLGRDARMLAEALGAAGWRTGAVTEDGMLDFHVGFGRGVSHYREHLEAEKHGTPSRKVAHTIDKAIDWLERSRQDRFFLFVHTYAVHWPYLPPDEYKLDVWWDGTALRPVAEAPKYEELHLAYAGDVRQADAEVARLVDTVRRLRLERQTIVIITSDHGEAFFEHNGLFGHGMMIYDEIMRVPMVMWGPGHIPAGRRIRTPVSLVDLAPTIAELAGAPPLPDVDGESQVARLRGAPEDLERVVFAHSPAIPGMHENQLAARSTSRKWILTESSPPKIEAFDLVADPKEQHPLDDPAMLEEGRRLFERYRALAAKASAPTELQVPEKTRQRLRELGYTD